MTNLLNALQARGIACQMEDLGGGIQGITFPRTDYFVSHDEEDPTTFHLTNGEDNGEANIYFTSTEIVEVVTHW